MNEYVSPNLAYMVQNNEPPNALRKRCQNAFRRKLFCRRRVAMRSWVSRLMLKPEYHQWLIMQVSQALVHRENQLHQRSTCNKILTTLCDGQTFNPCDHSTAHCERIAAFSSQHWKSWKSYITQLEQDWFGQLDLLFSSCCFIREDSYSNLSEYWYWRGFKEFDDTYTPNS